MSLASGIRHVSPGAASAKLDGIRAVPRRILPLDGYNPHSICTEIFPLDAPGMPVPGKELIDNAMLTVRREKAVTKEEKEREKQVIDDALRALIVELLTKVRVVSLSYRAGIFKDCVSIPGHLWNADAPFGPCRASVMVIGKMPLREDVAYSRLLQGSVGRLLIETLRKFGIRGLRNWYVTSLMKCGHPDGAGNLKAAWVKAFLPVLHQEIRLVRPQYILCLGADVSKALIGPWATVDAMEGRVETLKFSLQRSASSLPRFHEAQVMTVIHPFQVVADPQLAYKLDAGIVKFSKLLTGQRLEAMTEDVDHRVITRMEDLQQELQRATAEAKHNAIALDAEWHGKHPQNEGSYVRTIQLSWAEKVARCIRLRSQGGKWAFDVSQEKLVKALSDFFVGKRAVGHFFNADLEQLVPMGLDLRPNFAVPTEPLGDLLPWQRTRTEGGFDTGLAAHAISETTDLKLESLAMRFTTAPRYDIALHNEKKALCKALKIKDKDLLGYGDISDDVLEAYALYDVDVEYRLFVEFQKQLDCDQFGNSCREAFWTSMQAVLAVLEINSRGLLVDRDRLQYITLAFLDAKQRLLRQIREWANWPELNLDSPNQVRELLFGEMYNGKKSSDGRVVRLRPMGARTFGLTPILSTAGGSKRAIDWNMIMAEGLEDEYTAGTGKSVLSILWHSAPHNKEQVGWLQHYRYVSQVVKNFLSPKLEDVAGILVPAMDKQGRLIFKGGLGAAICDDGAIRTHIAQTAETGRYKSSRPPMQNLSKTRVKDYKIILGDAYRHGIREVFKARPGYVFVSADYTGAELMVAALLSNDKALLDHCRRSSLDENDPEYFDTHSSIARLAFRLDCSPTKKGLADIGKAYLRNIAKTVMFGKLYGRGAKAIAIAAREEGVDISVEEAQEIINTIDRTYPNLKAFFDGLKARVRFPRYICGAFGRYRRFPVSVDRNKLSDFERQAMNFPMQNAVAEIVSRALGELYRYREQCGVPDMYYLDLQVHDEILSEVRIDYLDFFIDEVLPYCMETRVPVYPCDFDGSPTGEGPYFLKHSKDVSEYWSQPLTVEDCDRLGIDRKYAS